MGIIVSSIQRWPEPRTQANAIRALAASVVVLSYNSEHTIRRCLASLVEQQTSLPFEVIVVDSSLDSTPKIVEREFPAVTLIHRDRRALPGEARNIGIQAARGEIIAFLASDCVADPNWLEARVRLHQEGFTAVGGVITNANPESAVGWAYYLVEYPQCLPNRPREVIKRKIIHNLSYRREVFDRFGAFPIDVALGEDTIFNRKLTLAEEAVVFDPAVRTGHINPTSLWKFLRHQYEHGRELLRACRNQYLVAFWVPDKWLSRLWSLRMVLVVYPWRRARNSVRYVFRSHPEMRLPLIISFPLVMMGIYSAALGAAVETFRRRGSAPF